MSILVATVPVQMDRLALREDASFASRKAAKAEGRSPEESIVNCALQQPKAGLVEELPSFMYERPSSFPALITLIMQEKFEH